MDTPHSFAGGATSEDDDVSSILTVEERFRLKEVITHDVEIKQFLQVSYHFVTKMNKVEQYIMFQESHTTEKMLMLKDYRQLGKIIEPQKWDVLIRIIDNSDALSMTRFVSLTTNKMLIKRFQKFLYFVSFSRGSGSHYSSSMQRVSGADQALDIE